MCLRAHAVILDRGTRTEISISPRNLTSIEQYSAPIRALPPAPANRLSSRLPVKKLPVDFGPNASKHIGRLPAG
jgi:hypothetical protein